MQVRFFKLLLFVSFLVLLSKLFWLQVVDGKKNKLLAEGNRIKIVQLPALRGVIFDRDGEVLARNAPGGREYVLGSITAHVLGYLGEATEGELNELEKSKEPKNFTKLDARPRTSYGNFWGNKLEILVGKMGIEKEYDGVLRGVDGGILIETDTAGDKLREIGRQESQVGESIYLTIDGALQQRVFEMLEGRKGAVVVSDPRSGEILASASSPSFNPNIFTQKSDIRAKAEVADQPAQAGLSAIKKVEEILSDSDQPMFNRSISGLYPPGSTFKIVTAVAGLQEGKIDENTTVEDTGEIRIGRFVFGNWYYRQYGRTEGALGLVRAIKRSNDIFFYRAGEWLGAKKLAEWAHFFGLGQALGIDLPGEADGLVPTPEWKEKEKKEPWYLGDTFITAIGQGNLLLTPLQVNSMMSVVASGGKLCRPHLLKEVKDGGKTNFTIMDPRPRAEYGKNCQDLEIGEKNLRLVQEGLKEACESGGTGWPFFKFKIQNEKFKIDNRNYFEDPEASRSAEKLVRIPVGCKTGTAEYGDPQDRTHAWFTVYAPWEEPEIVVTVLLEGVGEGSYEAAPVAKEILEYWFERKQ